MCNLENSLKQQQHAVPEQGRDAETGPKDEWERNIEPFSASPNPGTPMRPASTAASSPVSGALRKANRTVVVPPLICCVQMATAHTQDTSAVEHAALLQLSCTQQRAAAKHSISAPLQHGSAKTQHRIFFNYACLVVWNKLCTC